MPQDESIDTLEQILRQNPKKLQEFLSIFIQTKPELALEDVLSQDIHSIESEEIVPVLCEKFAHFALSDEELNLFVKTIDVAYAKNIEERLMNKFAEQEGIEITGSF